MHTESKTCTLDPNETPILFPGILVVYLCDESFVSDISSRLLAVGQELSLAYVEKNVEIS